MFHARLCLVLLPAFSALLVGCASGPDPSAFRNKTFYEYGAGGQSRADRDAIERPYPPLDITDRGYMGVQVLSGIVRFSRPTNWMIRRASIAPEGRFIEYVSPSQVMVSIYERLESPLDPWRDVMSRYEADLTAEGGKVIGHPFPIASFNAQGREYVVERGVAAPKTPFVNRSREILLRSNERIVLVQIVHQGDGPSHISDEVLPALTSMQVL
jgi:hypothetical protein